MYDKVNLFIIIIATDRKLNLYYDRMWHKMKKFVSLFIIIAVLMCIVPSVSAAGTAYWGGPDVVRAGDTITLTFYAGGGIYGGSGSVSYDPAVLTLQGYTQAIGGSWAVEFSGNTFVFYDNSMSSPIQSSSAIFRASFTVNPDAPTGAAVSVTASGVKLSDGQQDFGVGSTAYSTTVAEPLSKNCDLSSLTASGVYLSPAFSAGTTSYYASVPYSVSSVSISATAADSRATVSVYSPTLVPGATTTASVTVTAENGDTKTYYIQIARAQDPNYVASGNAELSALTAEGYTLSPAFSAEVTQYYVWLPYEAQEISLSAEAADSKASFVIGSYTELIPGAGTDIPITVTAENGSVQVYTVTVVRAPEHDKVEAFLSWQEEPTEPVTEPSEPVTEPSEPETQPVPEEPAEPEPSFYVNPLLAALLGAALGAGITALIAALLRKRKN